MENIDSSYLVFKADEIFYLLSLSCVERIMDASRVKELSFADFLQTVGGNAYNGDVGHRYCIRLKTDKGRGENIQENEDQNSADRETTDCCEGRTEKTGILVDHIDGIVESDQLVIVPLTKSVINRRNCFLKAGVRIKTDQEERWGYLLDAGLLKERIQEQDMDFAGQVSERGEKDKPGQMIQAAEECRPSAEAETAQFLTLKRGGRTIYIDRELTVAVVMRPEILKVPMSPRNILGISFYEGELVVYYDQSPESGEETGVSGNGEFACSVIFRTESGQLAGMAGDSLGEGADEAEVKVSVLSLGNGIWEKKSD